MMETTTTIQEVLQIYQILNGKLDTFLIIISIFATVFAVIIAVIVAFFTIRQITVEKEIKQYKDDIKKQKENIEEEAKKFKEKMKERSDELIETHKKIQEELDKISQKEEKELSKTINKQKVKKLEEDLEKLKEQITYNQGMISSPRTVFGSDYIDSNVVFPSILSSDEIKCRKCAIL